MYKKKKIYFILIQSLSYFKKKTFYGKVNNGLSVQKRLIYKLTQDPNVKSTTSTKKYTKNCPGSLLEEPNLNECEMSVVCLPPTPLKPEETQGGVSSQILPLNRFSSDSSLARSNPPPAYKDPPHPTKSKPIAEVSPFSSKKVIFINVSTKNLLCL